MALATRQSVAPRVRRAARLTMAGALVIFGSFGWGTGLEESSGGLSQTQLIFRVLPLVAAAGLLLVRDFSRPDEPPALARMWRMPLLPFSAAIAISIVLNDAGGQLTFLLWKTIEYGTMLLLLAASDFSAVGRERFRSSVLKLGQLLAVLAVINMAVRPASLINVRSFYPQLNLAFPPLQPNRLGTLFGVLLVIAVGSLPRDRRRTVVAAFAFIVLLAQSRSAFLVLAVWIPVMVLRQSRDKLSSLVALLLGGAAIVALAGVVLDFLTRGDLEGFLSLSNRDLKWSESIRGLGNHIWFGRGTGVSGRFLAVEQVIRNKTELGQAHSAPLEIFLSHGLLGGVPIMVTSALVFVRGFRRVDAARSDRVWVTALGFLLVMGFSNSFIFLFSPVSLLFFVCICGTYAATQEVADDADPVSGQGAPRSHAVRKKT